MKNKVSKIGIILGILIFIALITLWFTGVIGIWMNGMAYIANNTKDFTDISGYSLQGKYSISINLNDLQSNIGKELYNDGSHRVYVNWVDNTGSSSTGGYRIGFRSCGEYSLTNATLVSGIHHITSGENLFTEYMSGKMTAKYNGKTYNCLILGISGLNYKDGDDFAFYIFPPESYEKGEIALQEKGIVQLTATNLYKNVWAKK